MPVPRAVRFLEVVAALLSAGLVVLGTTLAVLIVVAPALVGGTGLMTAGGPRLDRVLVQLIVGGLGEFVHLRRSRFPTRARPAAASAVILVCFVAMWWAWWR